jgi:hypothetical protein
MKRGPIILAVALHAAAWLGFEAGRHDLTLHPSLTTTESGDRALRLRWSSTPPEGGRPTGGRLDWMPGLWRPHVVYAAYDPEPCDE